MHVERGVRRGKGVIHIPFGLDNLSFAVAYGGVRTVTSEESALGLRDATGSTGAGRGDGSDAAAQRGA